MVPGAGIQHLFFSEGGFGCFDRVTYLGTSRVVAKSLFTDMGRDIGG